MINDRATVAELARVSKPGERHVLLQHYLYFQKEADARAVATELQRRGFHTEERLGADGVNWLVLAQHDVVPTEASIFVARQMMEALVRPSGGEYDGWEAEVK